MSTNRTKLIIAGCLLLGLFLGILGCISVIPDINLKGNPNSLPIRSLKITVDVDQREEFFAQMQKFADKHSLEFTLSLYGSDGKIFLVAIYGDGFHISASYIPESTREIDIGFYNEASTPTPQKKVDELFIDLKSLLGEIPNVTIIEEK